MRRFFSILFVFVVLFSSDNESLYAQQGKGSVKGFVRDSTTGEALSLANVIVKGVGQGAATDSRGFYFISGIRPGKIVLRVSLVGYATKEVNAEIVASKVATANIRLAPVVYESGVVTATAQRRARYDTEISTQPIGSTEIEIVPAAVEADLFRTLSILPGVVSTSDVTSQFYVRGGSGDQNMIILDGMTIYNPFHALGLFSIFDADAVKEAEVLKGGFPAQYGNRLSSIINIKTREGNSQRLAGKVSASFLSVKASAEGPTPWDGAWIVSARKSTFNDVLKKFVRTDVPFDFYDIIARANMETGDAGRLSVHMLLSGDQILQSNPKSADYFWDNRGYSLTWFQVLENRYFIDASVSFSSFKGELRPKTESELPRRLSEVEEVYFNGTINYFRDDGDSYGAGFMFRLPRYHFAFTNASNFDRDVITRNSETGLWFKYKFKQFYPFMAEVGFRSDITAILGTENSEAFEPRVSMTYVVSNDITVKASYSRVHQRSITITNEDDIVSLFEIWIPVPEELPAEQADHFIAGVEGDIPLIPGLNFNLQGYLKNFNSLVDYNRDKVDATDPDFSEGRGSSYGVEFFIEERNPVYYGWLSYTYSVTSITTGRLTYFPRYDRRHSLNLVLGWKPGNGWDFNMRWEYGSGLPFTRIVGFYDRLLLSGLFESSGYGNEPGVPYTILGKKNDGRLPAFHRLDFSAAKTFYLDPIRITVEANVINAYDRDNMFYFDRNTGERVDMLPFLATATLRIAY